MHYLMATLLSLLLATTSLTHAADFSFLRPTPAPAKDPPNVWRNDFFRQHLFTDRGDKTTFGFRFRSRPQLPMLCLDVTWTRGSEGRVVDFAPAWGVCKWERKVDYPLFADGIDWMRSYGLSDEFYKEVEKRAESDLWPGVRRDIERGRDYDETLFNLYVAVQNWSWIMEEQKKDEVGAAHRRRSPVVKTDALAQGQTRHQNQKEAVGKPLKGESVNGKFVDQVKQSGHDLVRGTKEEKANMHRLCDRCFDERQ